MKPLSRPAADAAQRYFQGASTWADDVNGALRRSRRTAWRVAAVALVVAALEAVALAALAPLKTVVPYTLTVDRQTGAVEAVSGVKPGALTQDQALAQSFLVQYVIARESFDASDLRENYRKTLLWSADEARAAYQRLMQKTTPDSPLNLYSANSLVSVTIKSVSLLTPTTALVRFERRREEGGVVVGPPEAFAAVAAFRWSNAPMSLSDRFINPLGFQVTRYRRDGETPASGQAFPGSLTR